MSKLTKEFKNRMAATEQQQKITEKIFYNSKIKDKEGKEVTMMAPGKYYLYSKQSDKKIGWIKIAENPTEASYGWCNLPAYMKMEEPPEIPEEFINEEWDEVDLSEYGEYGVDEEYYRNLPGVEDRYLDDARERYEQMQSDLQDSIYENGEAFEETEDDLEFE